MVSKITNGRGTRSATGDFFMTFSLENDEKIIVLRRGNRNIIVSNK